MSEVHKDAYNELNKKMLSAWGIVRGMRSELDYSGGDVLDAESHHILICVLDKYMDAILSEYGSLFRGVPCDSKEAA